MRCGRRSMGRQHRRRKRRRRMRRRLVMATAIQGGGSRRPAAPPESRGLPLLPLPLPTIVATAVVAATAPVADACNSEMSTHELDRLSSLPDDVLHQILSSLTIKQCVSTCVVSRRWNCIFPGILHLNFTDKLPPHSGHSFMDIVDKFLFSAKYNIKKLTLTIPEDCYQNRVNAWLDRAVQKNIQELRIHIPLLKCYSMPNSLLHLQSLKLLHFGSGFRVSAHWPDTAALPSLEELFLRRIEFEDNESLGAAISSSCPRLKTWRMENCRLSYQFDVQHLGLEDFSMNNCTGLVSLVLSCPELKQFTINKCLLSRWPSETEKTSVTIAAPNLKSFSWTDHINHFVATSCFSPIRARIGFMFSSQDEVTSDSAKDILLHLSETRNLAIDVVSAQALRTLPVYQHLEVLHLSVPYKEVRDTGCIFQALQNFPNLRTLEILNERIDGCKKSMFKAIGGGANKSSTQGLCLDRLVEINISRFQGTEEEMEVIKLLLKIAGSLEMMKIVARERNPISRPLEDRFLRLQPEIKKLPSASSKLRFRFEQP